MFSRRRSKRYNRIKTSVQATTTRKSDLTPRDIHNRLNRRSSSVRSWKCFYCDIESSLSAPLNSCSASTPTRLCVAVWHRVFRRHEISRRERATKFENVQRTFRTHVFVWCLLLRRRFLTSIYHIDKTFETTFFLPSFFFCSFGQIKCGIFA